MEHQPRIAYDLIIIVGSGCITEKTLYILLTQVLPFNRSHDNRRGQVRIELALECRYDRCTPEKIFSEKVDLESRLQNAISFISKQ